jgi:hypothetical protein
MQNFLSGLRRNRQAFESTHGLDVARATLAHVHARAGHSGATGRRGLISQ